MFFEKDCMGVFNFFFKEGVRFDVLIEIICYGILGNFINIKDIYWNDFCKFFSFF